jgi:hypothetical protein
MTDYAIALGIVSAVVVGSFIFGVLWIRIERRQAKRHFGRRTPPGQQAIHFPEERELATMAAER